MPPSSYPDGALAERQLLELEDLLRHKPSQHHDQKAKTWNNLIALARSAYGSFWRQRTGKSTIKEGRVQKQALRPTAYLDGLRGFAALLVYSLHHQNWARADVVERGILENAFGWERHRHFATFHGFRIFFSGGHTAVAFFFIISGYVLALKPLSLIHAGPQETARLCRNLGSSLFRRWVRLYIPVLATTFIWMTTWHLFGIQSSHPIALKPEKTYKDELWRFYCDFKNFSFIFSENTNHYNDHTWSIPMEFRGSVVIWTTLLALAECDTMTRLLCEAGLTWYFLYVVDGWYCALFMMGALICDLDLLAKADRLPTQLRCDFKPWVWWLLFGIALYLAGVPSASEDIQHLRTEPGWYYLSFLKPQAMWDFRWFFRFWAATLAMVSIPKLPTVRAFFETAFCQYLGKISFALYLVHGPVLWTFGDRVYAATGRPQASSFTFCPSWINLFKFPSGGPFGLEVNYLAAHLILLPLTLGIAEIVTYAIDEPSLKFAHWAYQRATKSKEILVVGVPHTKQSKE